MSSLFGFVVLRSYIGLIFHSYRDLESRRYKISEIVVARLGFELRPLAPQTKSSSLHHFQLVFSVMFLTGDKWESITCGFLHFELSIDLCYTSIRCWHDFVDLITCLNKIAPRPRTVRNKQPDSFRSAGWFAVT